MSNEKKTRTHLSGTELRAKAIRQLASLVMNTSDSDMLPTFPSIVDALKSLTLNTAIREKIGSEVWREAIDKMAANGSNLVDVLHWLNGQATNALATVKGMTPDECESSQGKPVTDYNTLMVTYGGKSLSVAEATVKLLQGDFLTMVKEGKPEKFANINDLRKCAGLIRRQLNAVIPPAARPPKVEGQPVAVAEDDENDADDTAE